MKYPIILAAIPVAIWVATPSSKPPIAAKVVEPEGITARRMDEGTFRLRWLPVGDMPVYTLRKKTGHQIKVVTDPGRALITGR